MASTGYKLIGKAVWKGRRYVWVGTKLYVHHRYGVRVPSRRTVVVVGAGTTVIAGAIVLGAQRERG